MYRRGKTLEPNYSSSSKKSCMNETHRPIPRIHSSYIRRLCTSFERHVSTTNRIRDIETRCDNRCYDESFIQIFQIEHVRFSLRHARNMPYRKKTWGTRREERKYEGNFLAGGRSFVEYRRSRYLCRQPLFL